MRNYLCDRPSLLLLMQETLAQTRSFCFLFQHSTQKHECSDGRAIDGGQEENSVLRKFFGVLCSGAKETAN